MGKIDRKKPTSITGDRLFCYYTTSDFNYIKYP
jgi:hypothetical protein